MTKIYFNTYLLENINIINNQLKGEREMRYNANKVLFQNRVKIIRKLDLYEILLDKTKIVKTLVLSVGNIMTFELPLDSINSKGEIEEIYADYSSWKQIIAHDGPLYLYEDLGHDGYRWEVGRYHYYWNNKTESPSAIFDYNEKKILYLIRNILGYSKSNIIERIKAKLPPEMSVEFYCDTLFREGRLYEVNIRNSMDENKLECIAIVEAGACGPDLCKFEII